MAEELNLEIGQRIREERKKRRMWQEELAERANMSANAISKIEKGDSVPSVLTVAKIAKALGVSPSVFFDDPKAQAPILKRETGRFGKPEVSLSVEGAGGIESEEAFGEPTIINRVEVLFVEFRRGALTIDELEAGVKNVLEECA